MKNAKNVNVLISVEELSKRIDELAMKISKENPCGNTVFVCVLKGAFLFASDLCRATSIRVDIDFITASSYSGTKSTGEVKISEGKPVNYNGKHVIVVEDIVDTGLTMKKICEHFEKIGAKSVKTATLLSKKAHRKHDVEIDYCGFDIEDNFVVGYGLDYNQKFRDLPFIGIYVGPTD